MTLDEKYYRNMVEKLNLCIGADFLSGISKLHYPMAIEWLRQIAAAAFAAGAEAQKVADEAAVKTVFELADNGGKMAMLMCAIARIQSATVKWEVKDEGTIEFDEPDIPDGDGFPA